MMTPSKLTSIFYIFMTALLVAIGIKLALSMNGALYLAAIGFGLAATLNLVCIQQHNAATTLHLLLLAFTLAIAITASITAAALWWLWLPVALYLLPLVGKLLAKLPSISRDASKGHSSELEGTIKWFNSNKGFGFIVTDDESEYFVHFKALQNGSRYQLKNGASVRFNLRATERGDQATDVFIL